MLKTLITVYAAVAAASASCTDDAGCSLNGICNTATSTCACDAGWTSHSGLGTPDCGMLDLLPAPSDTSFHGLNNNQSSWGGSVLNLPVGGKQAYVMFAAEMTHGCTLRHWTTNSEVVMAVSDSPTGPYEEQFQIIKPWAHNPEAILTADGTVVIYTLGNGIPLHGPEYRCDGPPPPPPPKEQCTGPLNTTVQCATDYMGGGHPCPSAAQPVCSGFVPSKAWGHCCAGKMPPPGPAPPAPPGPAVGERWFLIHYADKEDIMNKDAWKVWNTSMVDFPLEFQFQGNWNPAPVAMPDGKVRIMVHTDWSKVTGNTTGGWMGEVIVEADHWKGPYRMISSRDITDCIKCEEDPFMWKDHRGNWHVIYHRMFDNGPGDYPAKGPEGSWSGGHSFSADGISNWSPITRCYNTSVPLVDGTTVTFVSRERPKLLIDANGRPTHLSNAVQPNQTGAGPDAGVTHTLIVPLNV